MTASAEIAPWLPTTASTKRLEADLKARGWRVWWTSHGTVRLFAPDGAVTEVTGATGPQMVRNAYASAQEYANGLTAELAREQWQELGSVTA